MPTLTIEGKEFGRGRTLFPDFQITLPETALGPPTLREVIRAVVLQEVAAFKERREERHVVRALTERQIEDAAAKGRVSMGGREEAEPDVDPQAAVDAALLAFQDGLYYVFIDEAQQEDLDAPVKVSIHSRLTFLRLVALAGG